MAHIKSRLKPESSVKSRWFVNIYLITIIVMIIISCLVVYLFASRCYHTAELALYGENSDVVAEYFGNFGFSDDDEFRAAANNYVSSFKKKNVMEVWVIDKNGKVVASSGESKLPEDVRMDDYYAALRDDNTVNCMKIKMPWGESVMALSSILKNEKDESFGAIRYIISLKDINREIGIVSVFVFLGFLIIAMLLINSGLYFVSTIVGPVEKITGTAKQIAAGDFSARIDSKPYNDEIGRLCDTINDMAKQLGENERMKDEFISTVSHEIRTPLTAIKGWGETLMTLDESEKELTQKGLSVITDETQRLSDMVEQLLDFSSIINGKVKSKKEKIDVCSLVSRAMLVYKQKAELENKVLSFSCNKNKEYYTVADANELFRVFVNILDNAIKYTQSGGNINVSVEKIKNYVRILVSDNGCGISKKDLQYVKQKFYKADSSVHGTGIGLAVADEIIKSSGGRLNITSTLGKGTQVEVLLLALEKEDM